MASYFTMAQIKTFLSDLSSHILALLLAHRFIYPMYGAVMRNETTAGGNREGKALYDTAT